MSLIDEKFISLVSSRLDKYKLVKAGLYNFRCPYCGDSQKHKNKWTNYKNITKPKKRILELQNPSCFF